MKILLLRQTHKNIATSKKLEEAGLSAICFPLFNYKYIQPKHLHSSKRYQGLIVTSSNTVDSLEISDIPEYMLNIPTFVVGKKTAHILKKQLSISSMQGKNSSKSLTPLISKVLSPNKGSIYYPSGKVHKTLLKDELITKGYKVVSDIVYEIVVASRFSKDVTDHLNKSTINGVLFYSHEMAEHFAKQINNHDLNHCTSEIVAFCLSNNIAKTAKSMNFKAVIAAEYSNEESLIQSIKNYKMMLETK